MLLPPGVELPPARIVVAAAPRPRGLPIEGLTGADPARGVHTSDTVMRMDRLPRRMVVIGGGFVACEFAYVFSAFGVEVTQVQRSATLLSREEAEVAHTYTTVSADRLDLRLGTVVTGAEYDGSEWTLSLGGPDGPAQVRADTVLLAVGRDPNTDRIDAEAGGLETDESGLLVVDERLRTSVPEVWALGDICSEDQLKHVANHHARIVAHNLAVDFGRLTEESRTLDDRVIPHGVFGHPQIAAFGPTRAQLEAAGADFVSYTQRFSDVAQGWAMEDPHGLLTVHAAPDGRLLAAHCIGPHSSTLIQPLIQAATFGQRALDVARGQYWIHPALAEVVENALLGLPLDPSDR